MVSGINMGLRMVSWVLIRHDRFLLEYVPSKMNDDLESTLYFSRTLLLSDDP